MTDYPGASLEAFDAAGAFEVGGGDFNWGQDYTESIIKSLFKVPAPTIGGAIDALRDALLKLPLEALQVFKDLIPDGLLMVWDNVNDAVDNIIGALTDNPAFLTFKKFQDFLYQLFHHPGEVINKIGQDLVDGLQDALGILNTMFNQFADIVRGLIVTPINTVVSHLLDWFRNLVGFQDTTTSNQVNLQNFQISALTAAVPRNPTWVCRYPVADVVYPEYLNARTEVFGVTDGASAGTAHTHNLGTSGNSTYNIPAYWSITQDQSRGSFITCANTTIMDTVGVSMYKGIGSIDNVYIELFREASDGSLTRITSNEVSSSLTTVAAYIEATIDKTIVQGGERYLLRVRNSSSVNTNVFAQGVVLTTNMQQTGFVTTGSSLTTQTSYTSSESTSAAYSLSPWGLFANKNLNQDDQSYSDDFNRSTMGGLWSLISNTGTNQVGIFSNKSGFTGLTGGEQSALYVRPTASDWIRADGTINNTLLATSGPRSGLLVNCARDFSQVVYLGVNLNSAKIYTGPWNSLTERASISFVGGDGDWSIYYDVTNNKYVVLRGGNTTGLEWTDSGNLMKHGRDYRYGGIRHSRSSLFSSAALDNWTLRDWRP